MATPTDDDNADDCISGNYYGYERGGTLDLVLLLKNRKRLLQSGMDEIVLQPGELVYASFSRIYTRNSFG